MTTNSAKKRVWESKSAKVNSCNSTGHEKCRRNKNKVDNIHIGNKKESSKTSEGVKADQRRTTLRDLTPFEETVIGIVGDTPIDGTPRGRDRGTTRT